MPALLPKRCTRTVRSVYGGSDLICVRGGWDALGGLARTDAERAAVTRARLYDEAMEEYPGFMASRKNYDVAEGLASRPRRRHRGQPRHAGQPDHVQQRGIAGADRCERWPCGTE